MLFGTGVPCSYVYYCLTCVSTCFGVCFCRIIDKDDYYYYYYYYHQSVVNILELVMAARALKYTLILGDINGPGHLWWALENPYKLS